MAPYPPFAYLVGQLGILFGGVGIAPLIIAENLVFVPLLALGCYQVGRLAFGPLAGLLAVVFALSSPLIAAQFHVFMIDAPETAMVAVSVWLIIATEGFSRLWICAVAGLAVGLGMLTKEPFAIFVVGIVVVTAVRGGWRSWRGVAIFAVIALAIALPWYIHEYAQIRTIGNEATAASAGAGGVEAANEPRGIAPPRLSPANLEWYLWNFVNAQLYLPLFVFAAVGWLWTVVAFARRRPISPLTLELAVGAFAAWALLTETYIHDTRYSMPLTVYLAVFGAGWIVRLPRRGQIAATAALVVVAIANTLGASFGAGRPLQFSLPGFSRTALNKPGHVTLYSNQGYLVSGPHRDGDLLAMLQALRRHGVSGIIWPRNQSYAPDFSFGGVAALAQLAGLKPLLTIGLESELGPGNAVLDHSARAPGGGPPCVLLDDGTGIWVRLGNPNAPGARNYCPLPKPHFYGVTSKL